MNARARSNARRMARLESQLPPPAAPPAITELRNVSRADAIREARRLKASELIFFPASGDPEIVTLAGNGGLVSACEESEATVSQLRRCVEMVEENETEQTTPGETIPPTILHR